MVDGRRNRKICSLVRNFILAAVLYTVIYSSIHVACDAWAEAKAEETTSIPLYWAKVNESSTAQPSSDETEVKLASLTKTVTPSPHADTFDRPPGAVMPKDDFLGPRPHPDTVANLSMLVEECRGSYIGLEKMRNVFDCLQFLAYGQARYHSLPEPTDRASKQDPRKAEYVNADGHNNTLRNYLAINDSAPASKSSLGTCSGPIIPYHVYWSGPATYRVEIFIKSYLYTQNLPCSRLWLWLDADRSSDAAHDMLTKDPSFARFLPFVKRGDIRIMSWNFPSRIPLPKDAFPESLGYYKSRGQPDYQSQVNVADGIVKDSNGQQWAVLTSKQMSTLPQSISDAVRFVILHLHGGVYMDMDVIMLRDMRPLLLPKFHNFAERWAAHPHPGDYNTAVMSLTANSSLSSYLLRGGIRMGLNFHPRIIGRMAWKDNRNQELLMLETATFDPVWAEFNRDREGHCTVPCLGDYGALFEGKPGAVKDEWESYDGPRLPPGARSDPASKCHTSSVVHALRRQRNGDVVEARGERSVKTQDLALNQASKEYVPKNDKYAANNRTLENFFRGAWTYHIHNQWSRPPEPGSWLDVVEQAHDDFFAGDRLNPYGECWAGPKLAEYHKWEET